jgi:hypothetical protein
MTPFSRITRRTLARGIIRFWIRRREEGSVAWVLLGTYFEACNCDVVCPCGGSSFLLPADNERCLVALAFNVETGEIEGVRMGGLSVILVVDAPGRMIDGNWRVGVIMDERASQEQAELLGAVFSGRKGGPMEALAPLIGEQLGIETAAIEYSNVGTTHKVKAGDLVAMEVQDIVPEGMSEPTRLVGVGHPASTTLTVARALSSNVSAFGLDFDNAGKNGHAAPFSWAA